MTYTSNAPGNWVTNDQISAVGIPAQNSEGVLHILTQGHDFQILKPIVRFDPVFVIDSHLRRYAYKGIGYQAVRVARIQLPVPTKNDSLISVLFVDIPYDNPRFMTLIPGNAPQPAHVADFVEREILNRSPLFHTCNLTTEYM